MKKKIGETLVSKNLITAENLEEALSIQDNCGCHLGKILIGNGDINAYKFYQGLAEQLELPFVNLEEDPCNEILLEENERQTYIDLSVIPWKKDGKVIVLATSEISPELEAWASKKFMHHSFVITSPIDVYWTVQKHFATNDDEDAREMLWKENPLQSAKQLFLTSKSKFLGIVAIFILAAIPFFENVLWAGFIAINIFYFSTLLSKTLFFIIGMIAEKKKKELLKEGFLTDDKELPVYTLLIPLYKENKTTVSHLFSSIRKLDYPKSKLDVKLIVEKDDIDTIDVIKEEKGESFFEIIRVPFSLPRTKPKACNYALKFAKGEYVTIYDADDEPDPLQLRKVLWHFKNTKKNVVCVQARLNYYNRNENILTRMFAMEYSSWFNFMLLGLDFLKIPIPLGGTSNHFPIKVLRELYGWDPYNVTEDADLGVRLAARGYRTVIVDSTTMEEAPISLGSWIRQRSRWIKGYLQTYIVHMRKPAKLYRTLGMKGFLGFMFFIGAPSFVFLTIPFVILLSAIAWSNDVVFPLWFLYFGMLNFAMSIAVHIAIPMIVIARDKWWNMLAYSVIFPFYWLLHSVASFRALYQLIARPHFWDKTEHGVSIFRR